MYVGGIYWKSLEDILDEYHKFSEQGIWALQKRLLTIVLQNNYSKQT